MRIGSVVFTAVVSGCLRTCKDMDQQSFHTTGAKC